MRYLIQIAVMLGDIVLIVAGSWILYSEWRSLSTWILVGSGFLVWHKQGGFMAWNPKNIRAFLENAKRTGL